jgi:hypothetical protein
LTTSTPTVSDLYNLRMTSNWPAPTFSFALDGEPEAKTLVTAPDSGGSSLKGDSAPDPPKSTIQTFRKLLWEVLECAFYD